MKSLEQRKDLHYVTLSTHSMVSTILLCVVLLQF